MFQEPNDFQAESEARSELVDDLTDDDFRRPTLFKGWTLDDVFRHLHLFNVAADESAFEPEKFAVRKEAMLADIAQGKTLADVEAGWHDGKRGLELLAAWRERFRTMGDRWSPENPKRRVTWAGPDMSLRSSITARLMETWAHGQEVYDMLGVERADTDRLKGIAVLGVNTFGWTFVNRRETPPEEIAGELRRRLALLLGLRQPQVRRLGCPPLRHRPVGTRPRRHRTG